MKSQKLLISCKIGRWYIRRPARFKKNVSYFANNFSYLSRSLLVESKTIRQKGKSITIHASQIKNARNSCQIYVWPISDYPFSPRKESKQQTRHLFRLLWFNSHQNGISIFLLVWIFPCQCVEQDYQGSRHKKNAKSSPLKWLVLLLCLWNLI